MSGYKSVWTDSYDIHWKDCGPDGKANIMALFNYLQETAWNHANHLDMDYTTFTHTQQAWVMLRFLIQIKNFPAWMDNISISTWPRKLQGPYAFRDFRIYNEQREELAVAASTWIIININSRKPVKANLGQRYEDVLTATLATSREPAKIKIEKSFDHQKNHLVSWSDLDMNSHVNSTKYLQWSYDMLPEEFLTGRQIKECEINFLHEGRMNEQIHIGRKQRNDNEFVFCGKEKTSGKQVFSASLIFNEVA